MFLPYHCRNVDFRVTISYADCLMILHTVNYLQPNNNSFTRRLKTIYIQPTEVTVVEETKHFSGRL